MSQLSASNAANSGQMPVEGIATITPARDERHMVVVLKLTRGALGSTYLWHISPGVCGSADDAALGPTADYPLLTLAADGTGSATALVGSAAPTSGSFFVTVHAASGTGQALACGNLKQIIP